MCLTCNQFEEAIGRLGLKDDSDTAKSLVAAYTADGRHYHDARHVAKCLAWLERFRHLAERPEEIAMAIWFHDAVYDPQRNDNEELSAEWARNFLESVGADGHVTNRIEGMILATKTHEVAEGDGALMMDIDLAILGTDADSFDIFEQDVRREYAWVPADKYRAGRAAVLQEFFERDPMYRIPEFRTELESIAKENLGRRIAELNSGVPL